MTMRSLVYVEPSRVEWREVPAPRLHGPIEAIVEPAAASRCDFDRFIVSGATPLQGPFAIGHEAVVRVIEVGDAVHALSPGDPAVVVPTITCGECAHCRRGLNAHCQRAPLGAAYGVGAGFGGLFDDLVRVPYAEAMLTSVPRVVDPVEVAAAGDSISLGRAIMSESLAAGATRIGVFGRGEHGLFQVAFANLIGGAEQLVYVDDDATRRDLAAQLGATATAAAPEEIAGPFDVLVDASANPAWLRSAVNLLEPEGVIECLGGYFDDISLPGFAMYLGGPRFRFGQGNTAPHIASTVDIIAANRLKPSNVWATQVDWADLPAAYVTESPKIVAKRPFMPAA